MIESREELEADRMGWIVLHAKLKSENEQLRKRVTTQRRELRRLNKYLGPYWAGFSRGLGMAAEARLRAIMNAAFGHERVRAAELSAIASQSDARVDSKGGD